MSEKTDLNAIDGSVSKAVEDLQSLIAVRTDKYDERSEAWQESDKGQEYSERTNELQSALDDLEDVQAAIQALIT